MPVVTPPGTVSSPTTPIFTGGEVTVINKLIRKDQTQNGPILPVVHASQVEDLATTVNPFVAISRNQYGSHPAFTSQSVLNAYLLTLASGPVVPVIPTTYTATQSFTATCGTGTSGTPVTRSATRTSLTSQVDATTLALAAATTDATAALVCTPTVVTYQAVSQSYTTTAQDYINKCGTGTTGTAVTRSSTTGTSTVSQAAANSLALQDATSQAITAITCPVPAPTFNRTLNPGENVSTVTYNGTTGSQFQFNVPLSASTAPNPATMLLYFPAGTQIGQVDYNGADTGTQCAVLLNGIQHLTTFTNGSVTLT